MRLVEVYQKGELLIFSFPKIALYTKIDGRGNYRIYNILSGEVRSVESGAGEGIIGYQEVGQFLNKMASVLSDKPKCWYYISSDDRIVFKYPTFEVSVSYGVYRITTNDGNLRIVLDSGEATISIFGSVFVVRDVKPSLFEKAVNSLVRRYWETVELIGSPELMEIAVNMAIWNAMGSEVRVKFFGFDGDYDEIPEPVKERFFDYLDDRYKSAYKKALDMLAQRQTELIHFILYFRCKGGRKIPELGIMRALGIREEPMYYPFSLTDAAKNYVKLILRRKVNEF